MSGLGETIETADELISFSEYWLGEDRILEAAGAVGCEVA
ncbi:predicted protein [Sclerotinia sclerotiorum 1980 UF-70]|uniref:Uncharacterized protein n=1 Tax=Sclerotinia sclerotiorum (strain ATCC 18683 / 1980 / Ss-1) TaxID=665079 RepID=A7EKM3_SCLS1|nr:predicted protein [Sclerotinia sclerotiorum 1980 UF-70]EDO03389.1 predicted protein [Sclerotinia sclerotiorum 1980 UF-70]